jgi:hypothetical protein
MTAMDKATENAQEMLRDLSIKYNRAARLPSQQSSLKLWAALLLCRVSLRPPLLFPFYFRI